MAPSTSTTASTRTPTFADLGVRTFINCRGTYTILSGSRALPQVAEASLLATNHYVHMDELMLRVGERLAELTGAEWGYVASGCAAALTEIAAAAIAGADPELMARLPDTTGMKDEVIMQSGHRCSYDRAMRMTGARIVEVVTLADLEAAIGERTALIAMTGDQAHLGQIPLEAMIEVGRRRGIPCLVDAAAERPDVPNRYLAMGADAVAYSGGKCLRGPQSSGLVLGRKSLLWAAYLNGSPHHSLGRPMKASKEEVMGLLAAVEAWVRGRDHQAEWRMWEGFLATVAAAVAGLPSLETAVEQPGVANVAPTLRIAWNAQALGCTPAQVHQALWEGEPAIAVHLLPDGLRIMPYMMEAGEAEIVAARLHALLTAERAPLPHVASEPAAVSVEGLWTIAIRYVLGSSVHSCTLAQEGSELKGTYRSRYASGPLVGEVRGRAVTFRTVVGCDAGKTEYAFSGMARDDGTLGGSVALGQYGSAEWTARRPGS